MYKLLPPTKTPLAAAVLAGSFVSPRDDLPNEALVENPTRCAGLAMCSCLRECLALEVISA